MQFPCGVFYINEYVLFHLCTLFHTYFNLIYTNFQKFNILQKMHGFIAVHQLFFDEISEDICLSLLFSSKIVFIGCCVFIYHKLFRFLCIFSFLLTSFSSWIVIFTRSLSLICFSCCCVCIYVKFSFYVYKLHFM